jgi:hypothetical protein
MGVQGACVFEQSLEPPSLACLTMQGAHLTLHLGYNVGHAQEVGLGVF